MNRLRRIYLAAGLLAVAVWALPVGRTAALADASNTATAARAACGNATPGFAHCDALIRVDAAGLPIVGPAPAGYGPSDLISAYNLGPTFSTAGGGVSVGDDGGAESTVAIVDAYDDPNVALDLEQYRLQYGIPPCGSCLVKVNQQGLPSPLPTPDAGWSEEISLDVDMVSAICRDCRILLVEANSNSSSDLAAAEDTAATLGATEISNSYGGAEWSGETSLESHYNHAGVAITASSGDNGYGVEYPAASQYVTAVGGTHLVQGGGVWSETAWSGAGSGCSAYIAKPAWQLDSGCSRRTVADVSAVADPNTGVAVYDTYGLGGWSVFGGTSVASPIIASVYALNGVLAASGPSAADSIYYAARHTPSELRDIRSGSNGTCSPAYLCTAVAGYDGPTGNGSPNDTLAFTGGVTATTCLSCIGVQTTGSAW